MEEGSFYDVHMHAFNLSHPYFYAFIQRFKIKPSHRAIFRWLGPVLASLAPVLMENALFERYIEPRIKRRLNRMTNLLAVMENDLGSYFLLVENCLREGRNPPLQGNELHIGDRVYESIILTPLMMDFGYKGKTPPGQRRKKKFHYDIAASKPIAEQVTDVFNGIKKYFNTRSSEDLSKKFPALVSGTSRVLEIYPFLGLNTRNYELEDIDELLDKYFANYNRSRHELFANMGRFDGNIDDMRSNFFAGVKVYPPLGFDPWPDDTGRERQELKKVTKLYKYCSERGIPIVSHGGSGGFNVLDSETLKKYTLVSKWDEVLDEYPRLKLNLAHFTMEEKAMWILPNPLHPLRRAFHRLVLKHKNAYVDFSCQAMSDRYYVELRKFLDSLLEGDREKLRKRILFGSDFSVNLISSDSYNHYLDLFSKTTALSEREKFTFCCSNPERFLFALPEA